MSDADGEIRGKNDLVRHLLATLAYRTTKIIRDAPEGFPGLSLGDGVRTPERILSHINLLMQLSNRFWSPTRPLTMVKHRALLEREGWEGEVELFYRLLEIFDATLKENLSPRQHNPERILQGPMMDAFTHVGQLALLRRMAGFSVKGESFANAEIRLGQLGPDQPFQQLN